MIWIAPSEKDTAGAALETRLWDAADQFRAKYGINAREYSAPVLGLSFLRFAAQCIEQLALVAPLSLLLCGGCSTAPQIAPGVPYTLHELRVVKDVLPMVTQPDHGKWRALKVGQTEAEVVALLGNPYRKDPRPEADTEPGVRHLYSWYYGEISFKSFTTKGSYYYSVMFHEGRVDEVTDPWNGRFSPDGRPTVPELVLPEASQTLHHYPRFMDFRWQPSSGTYPIEYCQVRGIEYIWLANVGRFKA